MLMRRHWFTEFLKVYEAKVTAAEAAGGAVPPNSFAPQLVGHLPAEKTVDHSGIVIDLLSRSYEQFKRNNNSRMMLFVAGEIAKLYRMSGRHDMALKYVGVAEWKCLRRATSIISSSPQIL